MKKVLSLFLLGVLVAAGCTGTTLSPGDQASSTSEENSVVNSLIELLEQPNLSISNNLIAAFYNYYQRPYRETNTPFFSHELRLLPEMAEGELPNWDELTLFIHEYCVYSGIGTREEGYLIPADAFDAAVTRFFPALYYTHKGSEYLTLEAAGYYPNGFDVHGSFYYRLTKILMLADGIYTASFDGFKIGESDWFDEATDALYYTNMKALRENGWTTDIENSMTWEDNQRAAQIMLEIFLNDDYPNNLKLDERIEITFRLSGDATHPFTYLSCHRELIQ